MVIDIYALASLMPNFAMILVAAVCLSVYRLTQCFLSAMGISLFAMEIWVKKEYYQNRGHPNPFHIN